MTRTNVDPRVWGPPAWTFIDAILQSYPDTPDPQDLAWITDFLVSLAEALPCETCRNNYNNWMTINPIEEHIASKDQIQAWLLDYKTWAKAGKPNPNPNNDP